ncbi:hypothetical protein ACJZ2D_010691 [Fusarium nematophilum]
MASQVIPISCLNLEPETVKFQPANMSASQSASWKPHQTPKPRRVASSASWPALMCNCSVMTALTYHFLSHRCSGCGIRFVVVPWARLRRRLLGLRPGLAPGRNGFALVEYKPSEPMTAAPGKKRKIQSMASWKPMESTPHIRVLAVDGQREREVTTAQVFATPRDYILHTPRTTNGVTTYESRRSGIRGQVSTRSGYTVWNSCAGPLAWIERYVRDQQVEKVSWRVVLMDAYDRLVAMMDPGDKEDSV